ncbi:M50 family metallopeptidase [Euzebya sp.]|uniref:M50 family metallopeptidase n=1 Tax=Euzebya sp. TaxID=1971409 RepID=UPI0035193BB0
MVDAGGVRTPAQVRAQQARGVLLASAVVTAALWLIPGGELVGYPLVLVSTFVHEMGHGLAALLVGGDFVQLQVFGDASGVALTATDGDAIDRAVVAGGGLVGPAVAAAIGFTLGRTARAARLALLIGGVLGLVASALWVRSLVGWLVALGLVGVSLAVALVPQDRWSQLWLVFLSVQLGLSVFSRGEYLFASGAVTGAGVGRSDSAAIADALWFPHWFWGGVCGLISVAALGYGAWLYLRAAADA